MREGADSASTSLSDSGARPIRPDLVFGKQRLAVFVDGCYWHGCPEHHQPSKSNIPYWRAKIAANRERDLRHDRLPGEAGWRVLRIWEHEDPAEGADRVDAALARRIEPLRAAREP